MIRAINNVFLITIVVFLVIIGVTQVQSEDIRKSLSASVTQVLGVDTKITIDYSRPGVNGRTIWGDLVPYGMYPGNKYSKDKPYPWRAGANENSTITLNNDLLVEGNRLPAGKYGLHMIASEKDWVIIFSKKNDAWGSFSYDEKEDALRITVTPLEAVHEEWLTYGFENLAGTKATIYLHWAKLKVPFNIELAAK
jgi:hypothetical protein